MTDGKATVQERLGSYQAAVSGLDAAQIVRWAVQTFTSRRLVLASSLSVEDQVLTYLLTSATTSPRVLTLDTGRLFQETYDTMEETVRRYGFCYEAVVPDTQELEAMVRENGPNLFYRSVELRKQCCEVRKIRPLRRVLSTVDAWICGLRRDQSVTRTEVEPVAWDAGNGIYKVNPLYSWSEEYVWAFVRAQAIPINPLQDRGFRSIGCMPCTRAIGPDDDVRSGRWWWEAPEHKECGLHRSPVDFQI